MRTSLMNPYARSTWPPLNRPRPTDQPPLVQSSAASMSTPATSAVFVLLPTMFSVATSTLFTYIDSSDPLLTAARLYHVPVRPSGSVLKLKPWIRPAGEYAWWTTPATSTNRMPTLLSGRACRYKAASAPLLGATFRASRPTTVRKPPFSGLKLASTVNWGNVAVLSAVAGAGAPLRSMLNADGTPPVFLMLRVLGVPLTWPMAGTSER